MERARQLVVVTTAGWDTTAGVLRRYTRADAAGRWRAVGAPVPVVVGRAGLAWDAGAVAVAATAAPPAGASAAAASGPRKREGDGRSPAGVFPLDTAFGFAGRSALGARLPYVALGPQSECVDDSASAYYNTVVDRAAVPRVDWTSAERMRAVAGYRVGVIVGYNAWPVRRAAGSCIFLHVWDGPASATAGCTAMDEAALTDVVRWLDPARRPVLVQVPAAVYAGVRRRWRLPA
ncbi:hypothetical protein tb265_10800 [Gemmatimonadetes bacterium T265]|nr:hypothetical protein tb265_10800 [Gemmatimonadetes bacterium T265]